MALKWADFLISKVRYNEKHTHITHLYVHEDLGDTVGEGGTELRRYVVDKINNGYSFCTIVKDHEGKWTKGAKVVIERVDNIDYITTKPNGTSKDNLENLPEF